MPDSVRPHRRQPTRFPGPWDSPGKNTGVGCHFLLQCMKVKSESEVAQSCLTLCDPMDCSLPGSSVHGIFQAWILEWVAISFSRGFFLTQGSNPGLLHCRQRLYNLSHQRSPKQSQELLHYFNTLNLFIFVWLLYYGKYVLDTLFKRQL